MEFNEMKKIWDTQSNQAMYAIDEQALIKTVNGKKSKSSKIANRTEWVNMIVMLIAGTIVVVVSIVEQKFQPLPLSMVGLMYLMSAYTLIHRLRRIKYKDTFERTMLGDIEEALLNANFQINLSRIVIGFLFVIYGILAVQLYERANDWWMPIGVLVFTVIVFFAARWEHRKFYLAQRNSLLKMKSKLIEFDLS